MSIVWWKRDVWDVCEMAYLLVAWKKKRGSKIRVWWHYGGFGGPRKIFPHPISCWFMIRVVHNKCVINSLFIGRKCASRISFWKWFAHKKDCLVHPFVKDVTSGDGRTDNSCCPQTPWALEFSIFFLGNCPQTPWVFSAQTKLKTQNSKLQSKKLKL